MGLTDWRQTAKNVTDYRQNAKKNYRLPGRGPTLSIFFFRKKSILYFFYLSRKKPKIPCHKSFYKYTTKRVLKSVCRAYENFYKATRLVLHIHARNAQINSFQFNGKLYLLQTHRTAMDTKTAVSSANIFMSYIETQSLS